MNVLLVLHARSRCRTFTALTAGILASLLLHSGFLAKTLLSIQTKDRDEANGNVQQQEHEQSRGAPAPIPASTSEEYRTEDHQLQPATGHGLSHVSSCHM